MGTDYYYDGEFAVEPAIFPGLVSLLNSVLQAEGADAIREAEERLFGLTVDGRVNALGTIKETAKLTLPIDLPAESWQESGSVRFGMDWTAWRVREDGTGIICGDEDDRSVRNHWGEGDWATWIVSALTAIGYKVSGRVVVEAGVENYSLLAKDGKVTYHEPLPFYDDETEGVAAWLRTQGYIVTPAPVPISV